MIRFIKIRFVEWRDNNSFASLQRVGNEAQAKRELVDRARDKAIRLRDKADERLRINKINLADPKVQRPAYVVEADEAEADLKRMEDELRPLQDVAARMSEQNSIAARSHAQCGKFGFQVVDSEGGVIKIVDADGNDLPLGQEYSYEVSDGAPARPNWATDAWERNLPQRPSGPVPPASQ